MSSIPNTGLRQVQRVQPLPQDKALQSLWAWVKQPILIVAGLLVFLAFWEWQQTAVQRIPALFIPPPSAIFVSLVENTLNGRIPSALAWSMRNLAIGFVLAALLAIPTAFVMGSVPLVRRILEPYMWLLYSTPRIAFLPIIIVALGFGPESKVLVLFLSCLFPLLINTLAGVETVDAALIKAGRVFGATRLQLYTKIIFPFVLPFIMSGLRISIARGLVVVYVSEIYGSINGIGKLIIDATALYNTPLAFACLMVLLIISLVLVFGLSALERRVMPWMQEVKI
ncbi:MAG TPA: ABC transporter permease [Chloroflexaceae bacterium]|nr:ABC transporter permease [Chloroflexaceae bacterium]